MEFFYCQPARNMVNTIPQLFQFLMGDLVTWSNSENLVE